MSALALSPEDSRIWSAAGATALAAHVALGLLILGLARHAEPPVPDPVVLVDLPPPPASTPFPSETMPLTPDQPQPAFQPTPLAPLPALPEARSPLPAEAATLPRNEPPSPASNPAAQPTGAQPAQQRAEAGSGNQSGFDPAAQKAEADYKSLVGSYIRRNRFSPPQSKKAGLSGIVKVRFVVDRKGGISGVSVAVSSGHALLDGEALQFIQRLSPVPAFPRDLKKADIPLTITLKFDLERK